jgi:hypothetical protein
MKVLSAVSPFLLLNYTSLVVAGRIRILPQHRDTKEIYQ